MSESEEKLKKSNNLTASGAAETGVDSNATSITLNNESQIPITLSLEALPQAKPQENVCIRGENYGTESGETDVEKSINGKRTEVLPEAQVEIKDVGAENSELFIIQNSDGVDINNLDSEFLMQVKKAIEESGNNCKSIVIGDEGNNEATTFIINVVDDSVNSDSTLQTSSSVLENCTAKPLNKTSTLLQTTPSSSSPVKNSLVDVITTNPQSASCSISANNSIRIELPPTAELKDRTDMSVSTLSVGTTTSTISTGLSTNNIQLQNLVTLSSQLATTPHQTTTSSTTSPSVTTSQVAEQLISIAKRMMEDESQGSQKISVDESLGKIVIASPEVKQAGEKSTHESVITMYLSSPNDLKCKLNKMKTNSPVIVMQADEEALSYDENKENPPQDKANTTENHKSVYNENICEVVTPNDGKINKSDGIVAALSSSISTESTVYRCSECCYSSHNKHYYKQHVDLVHNEDRPYKCPFCDYAGKRRHALLEHMVVHSNQRPFTCNHCNATFRKKGHLTNHIKLHMSHRLVHCGVCQIQLPDTEAFEAHLRKIHRTDKLYKCKLCDHTVVDRNSMLAHLATHNESVVFSCPYCATYFETEKTLLSHMTDAHKVSIHTATIDASSMLNRKTVANVVNEEETLTTTIDEKKSLVNTVSANNSGKSKSNQGTNIVCSECGFICADTHIMKKHMWIHIDSTRGSCVQLKDQASADKKCPESSNNENNTNSNAMGVLKMNVVSGMKSLPDNIVYQCTTCKFTSKDNSIFIKHMLLHKTQQRKQEVVPSGNKGQGLENSEMDNTQSVSSTMPVLTAQLNSTTVNGASNDKKIDNAVPFVYDQSTCRYRCLICGYHCDFQRTIKAHIWKHSGNQNIDYPVFEQGKKTPAPSSTYFNALAADNKAKTLPKIDPPYLNKFLPNINSSTSTPPPVPLPSTSINVNTLQTQSVLNPSGKVVQLLPFKPPIVTLTRKDNPMYTSENQQIQNDKTLKQEHMVVTSSASTSSSGINFEINNEPFSSVGKTSESNLPSTLLLNDEKEKNITASQTMLTKELSYIDNNPKFVDLEVKVEDSNAVEVQSDLVPDEGCTEPSVVVEIVDSTPPDLELTGIVTPEEKTDVSDLEKSDSEAKYIESCEQSSVINGDYKNESVNQSVSKNEQQTNKYNLRKPKDSTSGLRKNVASRFKRSATLAESQSRKQEPSEKNGKQPKKRACAKKKIAKTVVKKKKEKSDEDSEEISTDDVQSAEEAAPVASQPKSGICSSLLAVIEQLRERSRTEEIIKRSCRRSKKIGGNTESMSSLELINNIERVNVVGEGMKLRCNLCHYTSFRLSNMKIHMKTHRQKKPSECSLCDFASASPELLQEHMLQHCKVRTYTCKFCPQSFNHKSALRAHMRMHKEHEPLLCAYCVFETTNPNEFREHMLVHSGCSSRLRCPGCDYIMNSKDELTPHLMKCKGNGNGNESESSSTESDKNVAPKKPVKSENKSKQKKKEAANDQIKKEKNAGEGKTDAISSCAPDQHSCVVSGCTFSSTNLKELQEHLSVHCNPSLMLCDLCDFKALHSRSLKSHMKRHANDQRFVQQPLEQYKCTLCGYVCHHLPSLKSHMWRHASDQSYSYEFTNDVINAAIDHDSRSDGPQSQADDPELLHRFIHSESRIMEGELTNYGKGNGQRPTCWVRFCCCSCGFETINKAKLNIHMRSHADVIQNALDVSIPAVNSLDVSTNNTEDDYSKLPSKESPKLTRVSSSTEDEEHPPAKKIKLK